MFPTSAFRETLGQAVRIFRQQDIRFHLTGGVASVFYGEPRLTPDIGIVIRPEAVGFRWRVALANDRGGVWSGRRDSGPGR